MTMMTMSDRDSKSVNYILLGNLMNDERMTMMTNFDEQIYTVSGKKRPRYFQLQLSHFLIDFYNFCTTVEKLLATFFPGHGV